MKIKNKWRALKIQSKNLLNIKIVVNYLDFVFHIEVKAKPKYNSFIRFSIGQKHKMARIKFLIVH